MPTAWRWPSTYAEITAGVLAGGLEANGEVRALGARFGGQLDLREAKLCNREGNALNLKSASIKQLTLGPVDIADPLGPVDITGKVRLYRSAISDLETDANPPSPLVATGTYRAAPGRRHRIPAENVTPLCFENRRHCPLSAYRLSPPACAVR